MITNQLYILVGLSDGTMKILNANSMKDSSISKLKVDIDIKIIKENTMPCICVDWNWMYPNQILTVCSLGSDKASEKSEKFEKQSVISIYELKSSSEEYIFIRPIIIGCELKCVNESKEKIIGACWVPQFDDMLLFHNSHQKISNNSKEKNSSQSPINVLKQSASNDIQSVSNSPTISNDMMIPAFPLSPPSGIQIHSIQPTKLNNQLSSSGEFQKIHLSNLYICYTNNCIYLYDALRSKSIPNDTKSSKNILKIKPCHYANLFLIISIKFI